MKNNQRIEKRKKRVEALSNQLKEQGFRKKDLFVDADKANIMALLTGILPSGIFLWAFIAFAGWENLKIINYIFLVPAIIISIFIHEAIHGFFFGLFAKSHFKAVEFGFLWDTMNPYCYCAEVLSRKQYLTALLMPGFILGTCTGLLALFLQSATCLYLSIFSHFGAGGDLLIAYLILRTKKLRKEELFLDHPDKPGVILFSR